MKKRFLFLLLTALWGEAAFSQFSLDGQFRPRTEYRHGYASPLPDIGDAGFAIASRARLNAASGQNWAWAMLTLKPKFLNTAKPE